MLFVRDIDDRLTSLVKKLEQTTQEGADKRLQTYVVVIGDDKNLEERVKDFVKKERITRCAVSMSAKTPAGFKVPADAEATIYFFLKQSAIMVGTFGKGELSEADVESINNFVSAKTESPFPIDYYAPAYVPEKSIRSGDFGADKAARGPNPCVFIFGRDVNPALEKVAAKMEAFSEEHKALKLDPFVVLVDAPEKGEANLQDLAKKLELKNSTLSLEKRERVARFRPLRDYDVTVMYCTGGVCRGVFTFRSTNFDEAAMNKMFTEMERTLREKAKTK